MSTVRDPYLVLGIPRSASAEEIKKAYHKLAKLHHPDRNAGDKKAEGKLQDINAAYGLLSDKAKRARYDAGEIDANGQERFSDFHHARSSARSSAGSARRGFGARNFFDADDFTSEDIINDIFSGMRSRRGPSASEAPKAGRDINYTLKVPFVEATLGGKRPIQLAGGKEVSMTIPPGTVDGSRLRLKGQGEAPRTGGPPGDAYIQIMVEPHPLFKREGHDISCEVPVSLQEAVLGGSIRVPTLSGLVDVRVPKNSNTGTVLRLKGKGVPMPGGGAGDQYVRLKVMLPDEPDDSLIGFLREWSSASGFNPRKKAGME